MKFICEKTLLQNACLIASRAVPSKSPISSLEGLLIKAEGGMLRITGYDLKKGIYSDIEADIIEEGIVVVNAKFFVEMIRRIPDGLIAFTSTDDNCIHVKCGKSEYDFVGLDVKEYPEIPSFEGMSSISVPENILKNMIGKTIFAVSKEDARPIYTGSLFEISENELTVVSVDGYRLARRCEKIENSQLESCSFVVPGFALSDIEKICSQDSKDDVIIQLGDKHISFTIGSSVVISRRLEGDFLNHRKSVPESFKYQIKINRQELLQVIERVALVLGEKNSNPIKLYFNNGVINCTCITPVGRAEDICTCSGNGEGLVIGFNDRYLTDALKAAEKDELLICLSTSSSPCVIKAQDGSESFTYMILPVRLHTEK